jgi:hypothetical protein
MASCRIAKECPGGRLTAVAVGFGKELQDLSLCLGIGNDGFRVPAKCRGAFQPTDQSDNALGNSCPDETPCEKECEPLEELLESPGGPFTLLDPYFFYWPTLLPQKDWKYYYVEGE